MDWLTNEILFYGGITVTVGSCIIALLYFCIMQIKKIRLDARLDAEYGERIRKK